MSEVSREEFDKLKKEIEIINKNSGILKEVILSNFGLIQDLSKSLDKLVKMLCNPDYEKESKDV